MEGGDHVIVSSKLRVAATRRHVIAPLILAGGATAASVPAHAKPVEASTFCGLFNQAWWLEYHDVVAWHVNAQGFDQNGNHQSVWIYTPTYTTYDSNHCWLQDTDMTFYWYGGSWQYLGETTKHLIPECYDFSGLPMVCYSKWSPLPRCTGLRSPISALQEGAKSRPLPHSYLSLPLSPIAAWAAARRATGTRNGLHET